MSTIEASIRVRRGTAAAWTSSGRVLGVGELGLETDTLRMKAGDGATVWPSLSYLAGGGSASAGPVFVFDSSEADPSGNVFADWQLLVDALAAQAGPKVVQFVQNETITAGDVTDGVFDANEATLVGNAPVSTVRLTFGDGVTWINPSLLLCSDGLNLLSTSTTGPVLDGSNMEFWVHGQVEGSDEAFLYADAAMVLHLGSDASISGSDEAIEVDGATVTIYCEDVFSAVPNDCVKGIGGLSVYVSASSDTSTAPTQANLVGSVFFNLIDDAKRVAYTAGGNPSGTAAAALDGKVAATRQVNGHALSADVTVTASDVGAPSGSGTSSGTNTGDETATSLGATVHAATAKTTPVDADEIAVIDSAASNVVKKLTWANLKATLKTYFDTLYDATGAAAAVTTTSISAVPTTRTVNGHALSSNVTVTASDVSLGNVTNDAQVKASDLDTDATMAANSDAKVASQKATKTALALKAPLASPAFTGTPTGITATHVGLGNVTNVAQAPLTSPIRTVSGTSDTPTTTDRTGIILFSSASAISVSIPGSVFAAGDTFTLIPTGTGQITTAASGGATASVPYGAKSNGQNKPLVIIFTSATTYIVAGDPTT